MKIKKIFSKSRILIASLFVIASLPIILPRYGIQIIPPIPITLGPNSIQSSPIEVVPT